MFQCDELIYIQMPKTGCTHIASLLGQLFQGRRIGKHNPATEDQLKSCNYFVSSIRDPWDWYLSLWTFGVQGGGGVRHRLVKRHVLRAMKSAIHSPQKAWISVLHELSKCPGSWRSAYDQNDNVASFRKWLRLIHDPTNSLSLAEDYGFTSVPRLCGFMTYRYLRLCCRNISELNRDTGPVSYPALVRFEVRNCYINYFIRQESLENDFCEAVEKVRPLRPEEKELIYSSGKTNTSKRALTTADYYDRDSIELISERERLLIEKFQYAPPEI